MAHAVRFHETGGPEVLRWEEVVGDQPRLVRLRHDAVGLNFADTYFRSGLYPVPLPAGLGVEAAGVVEAVGPGVTNVAVGDRVTYTGFLNTLGAYSTERLIPAAPLVRLPAGITCETAAAMTMRGLTSAYLLRRIHAFAPGDTILLHAAAGGVGLIVSQWAKLLAQGDRHRLQRAQGRNRPRTRLRSHDRLQPRGRREARARADGRCGRRRRVRQRRQGHLRRLTRFAEAARADGVRRHRVGPILPFDPQRLAMKGSLYLTRPALADYIADPAEKNDQPANCSRTSRPAGSGSRSTSATRCRTPRGRIAISNRARRPVRRCSSSEETRMRVEP